MMRTKPRNSKARCARSLGKRHPKFLPFWPEKSPRKKILRFKRLPESF